MHPLPLPGAFPPLDPDLLVVPGGAAKHRSAHHSVLLRCADRWGLAVAELLSAAVPVDCVCCGAEDAVLCPACSRRVRLLTNSPFRAEGSAPALMDVAGHPLLPVVAAGVYREELAQSILSFKHLGQASLRHTLGKALAGALAAAVPDVSAVLVVPVPTSTGAYLKRGFSPLHLMLKGATRALPGIMVADVLTRSGSSSLALAGGQKGLGRGARARQVRGSMHVASRRAAQVGELPCILVDDVLTTGATLSEAARALHLAGGKVHGAVVLAATRPPAAFDTC